jgi:flagellar FliJ protein
MSQVSTFSLLKKLASKEADKTAVVLAKSRQQYEQMKQQMVQLHNYQQDYRAKLNTLLQNGMSSTEWQNYQTFLVTLDKAINQHQQQLMFCQTNVDNDTQAWLTQYKKVNAFDTLEKRAHDERDHQQRRQEQKMFDEFAQRNWNKRKD